MPPFKDNGLCSFVAWPSVIATTTSRSSTFVAS